MQYVTSLSKNTNSTSSSCDQKSSQKSYLSKSKYTVLKHYSGFKFIFTDTEQILHQYALNQMMKPNKATNIYGISKNKQSV